jgi:Ca2+-binding RTX toxin-like protein
MLVMRTIEDTTNPVGELGSFRQPLGLDHFATLRGTNGADNLLGKGGNDVLFSLVHLQNRL